LHGALQRVVQALHPPVWPYSLHGHGRGRGTACLVAVSWLRGSFMPVAGFGPAQWLAVVYLGVFGGALTFFLWAFALGQTTPTRVAISVTVNPVTASLVGAALLGEPLRWNLVIGIATVFVGIWIATTAKRGAEVVRVRDVAVRGERQY
jgi:drug/metabolite transporter (DMT)-like permease